MLHFWHLYYRLAFIRSLFIGCSTIKNRWLYQCHILIAAVENFRLKWRKTIQIRFIIQTKTALLMLCLALSLSACKVLKTHIVKVTSSTEAQPHEVLLKTTKGYVYLSTQNMTEKQKHILKNLRPFQCLEVRTPEQFAMQNRVVRFSDFKIRALVEDDRECRKIKVTTRVEIH